MSRFVFALTLVLACAGAASAEYLPWPWGPGFYVMGAQTNYPFPVCCGPRDAVWSMNSHCCNYSAGYCPMWAQAAPTQIRVQAPAQTQIVHEGKAIKPVNGVITIELAAVIEPTTVNLVVRDSGKKDVQIPIAMIPGSRPSVMILN